MRTRTAPIIGVALALVLGMLAVTGGTKLGEGSTAQAAGGDPGSLRVKLEIAVARLATARYHDVQQAVKDGYAPLPPCMDMPPGEMNVVHYINLSLVDGRVRVWQPEGLLYRPDSDGHLQLAGVLYIKPDADGDPATTGDRPTLFGVPFSGPMPAHHGLPLHYHLHAWIWSQNPDGMFADPCMMMGQIP